MTTQRRYWFASFAGKPKSRYLQRHVDAARDSARVRRNITE